MAVDMLIAFAAGAGFGAIVSALIAWECIKDAFDRGEAAGVCRLAGRLKAHASHERAEQNAAEAEVEVRDARRAAGIGGGLAWHGSFTRRVENTDRDSDALSAYDYVGRRCPDSDPKRG